MFRKAGRYLTVAGVVAAFGAAWIGPAGLAAGAATVAGTHPPRVAAPKEDPDPTLMTKCPKGMSSKDDEHFIVWACNNGPHAASDELAALSMMGSLYDPMVKYMGAPPLPGKASAQDGESTKIDIYLTSNGQALHREHADTEPDMTSLDCAGPLGEAGDAVPDPETLQGPGDTEASGYIVASRSLLDSCRQDFASVLAHEFFHLLEYRYNDPGASSCPNFWFADASAVWAEWYFVPGSAVAMVYRHFAAFQQHPGVPLTDGPDHYADFVWPLFMQQKEAGSIANAWKAMPGKRGCGRLTDIVSAKVSFDKNFDSFAVENFDTKFTDFNGVRDWPVDFGPKYQDLKPLKGNAPEFPEIPPETSFTGLGAFGTSPWTATTSVSLPPLSARYDRISAGPAAESIEFDFSALTNPADLGIDLIAADPGNNKSFIKVPVTGTHARICFAADGADNEGTGTTGGGVVYVALDNHDGRDPATVSGSYTVTARTACAAALTGDVEVTQDASAGQSETDQTATMDVTLTTTTASPLWALDLPASRYSATYRNTIPADCPGGTITTQAAGSGTMTNPADFQLLTAYQQPYSQPPSFSPAVLFESGPGTIASPCMKKQNITQYLTIVNLYCPASSPGSSSGTSGTYATGDTAVAFNCYDTFKNGAQTVTNTIQGTLTAIDPMPCGLWTPGCSISAAQRPESPHPMPGR